MDRRILYSKKCCKYATAVVLGLFVVGIKMYADNGEVGNLYSNIFAESNKIMKDNGNNSDQHIQNQKSLSELDRNNTGDTSSSCNNTDQDVSQLSAGEKFQKMLQTGRGGMSEGSSIMADVNQHMMAFEKEMRNAMHDYSKAKTPNARKAVQKRIERIKEALYNYNDRVQQKLVEIQKKQAENLRKATPGKKEDANPYNPYDNGSGLVNPYNQ